MSEIHLWRWRCTLTIAITVLVLGCATTKEIAYVEDLSLIIGEIRGTAFMTEFCGEAFPDLRSRNESAYQEWRARYQPFLEEMENRFLMMLRHYAKGDGERYQALLKDFERDLDAEKAQVRRELFADAKDAETACYALPHVFSTLRWDLERFHAQKVANVRQNLETGSPRE